MQDDERNDLTGPFDGLVTTPPVPPPSPLDGAPTMADAYSWEDFLADSNRELVSVADLPQQSGLGEPLNDLLGGGLRAGQMVLIGARSAGAGKTAFLMQLADGLAARTAELVASGEPGPLTPVVIVSEMTPGDLTVRSVARWTKTDNRIFRDKKRGGRNLALQSAQAALEGGLGRARRYQRFLRVPAEGPDLVDQINGIVRAWREQRGLAGREVWPVVAIDPVQRNAGGENAIDGLDALSKAIRIMKNDHGFIVLLTSDTNTASARGQNRGGDAQQNAAAAIRGSYNLSHEVDVGMVLGRREWAEGEQPVIEVDVYKNRWGTASPDPAATVVFDWEPAHLALKPWTDEDMKADRAEAEKERRRKREAKEQKDSKGDNVPVPGDSGDPYAQVKAKWND